MIRSQPTRVEAVARGPLPPPLKVVGAARHHPRLCLANLADVVEAQLASLALLHDPAWQAQGLPDGASPSGGSVDELLAVRHG
jgi:hypothetical protein